MTDPLKPSVSLLGKVRSICQHVDEANATRVAEREPNDQGNAKPDGRQARSISGGAGDHLEWVIGADGKARRVKPGIRLLAHGVPARVAKLRALGNAIDLRPASQFILAATEAVKDSAE